ncbi:putative DnaJ domain, Chaperone J-domain superfamily [Helianthus anomalus]
MDPTIEEALRAKENAENLFLGKDFPGAKQCALRAQTLCPQLEGISQMVATFEIYAATMNQEIDFYSVLGLDPSADKSLLKKRYKKMAVLLHPDKNKTVGANEAFKLVSEAWCHTPTDGGIIGARH